MKHPRQATSSLFTDQSQAALQKPLPSPLQRRGSWLTPLNAALQLPLFWRGRGERLDWQGLGLLLCFLLFIISTTASAQNRIAGRVSDGKGSSLANVIVKAYAVGQTTPAAYTKTDAKGNYVLLIGESVGQEVVMKYSVMGYHTEERRIKNNTTRLDVQMCEDPTKLREVTVRAPTVRAHGDTLTYHVENLRGKSDHNMEDVIKRIPGVTVENSGQIKYNGEPINRFYIEGLDMLNGRYSLATRNIKPDDVASVNVYENHQPVRVLEGVEHSKNAALNLKLKNSRLHRPVGNMMAGGGWGDGIIYKEEAFAMIADSARQHLGTLKANNFSENYDSEAQSHYADALTEERALAADILPDRPFGSPSVPSERYLNNNSLLVSVNNLYKLREGLTLTANADYSLTDNDYSMEANTAYAVGSEEQIVATDDNRTDLTRHKATLSLKWERNDSLRYVLNELNILGDWKRNDYALSAQSMKQHNAQDVWSATNNLQWVIRNKRRVVRLNSMMSLSQVPNGYLMAQSVNHTSGTMRQEVEGLSFTSHHTTRFGWLLGRNGKGGQLALHLGLMTNFHRIDLAYNNNSHSTMSGEQTAENGQSLPISLQPAASARANGYTIITTVGPVYSGALRPFFYEISMPVSMYNLRYTNHHSGESCSLNRPFFRPNIEFTFTPNLSRFRLSLFANYEHRIGSLQEFMKEPIYLTFRQMSELGTGKLSKTKQVSTSAQVLWNDPIAGRSINLTGGYNRSEYNHLWSSYIGNDGQTMRESVEGSTVQTSWNGNFSLRKTFYGKRLYMGLQGAINVTRSPLVRQDEPINVKGIMGILTASIEKHLFRERLGILLSTSWQRYTSKISGGYQYESKIDDYLANAHLSVFPTRKFEIYGDARFMASGVQGGNFDKQFYIDAGACLKLRHMEWELKARNLTNRNIYLYRSYSLSDLTTYVYHLRPIEFLLTAKWNF